ncbi:MAG: thiamine pyrophosphate-binding protein, partial [Desulfobulbia bacterium]
LHIDCDAETLSASYPTEVGVVSDARLAISAINRRLFERKIDDLDFEGGSKISGVKEAKWAAFSVLANSDAKPIVPERTVRALQSVVPEDAIIVADPGTPCPYIAAYFEFSREGRHFISNRAHGALGYSLSAAMGAWFGQPQKKVVAVMGDGSFGFTCGELETVVRYKMPITFIVISNSVYGWIKAGQKAGFDERYYSVDFNRTDHAGVAAAFGVKSWRVEDPMKLENVLREAVEFDGPTLVDVISQPLQEANAPVSEWIA